MPTRLITQTLSNIVTHNDTLMTKLWSTYMALPEEQAVLMYAHDMTLQRVLTRIDQDSRLLDSPDEHTVLATFVLITNCIHRSKERAYVPLLAVVGHLT
jgi:ataxin-10